jgi:hypothetical protein
MAPPRPLLAALLGALLLSSACPVRAASPTPAQLQALETALNGDGDSALAALLQAGPGLDPAEIQNRRRLLRSQFPDLRWQVASGPPRRSGEPTVRVTISGTRREAGATFRLDAEQQLLLESESGRFTGQTVLREQSILRSGEQVPSVSLLIPDAVLTGQRYDVDVIFDEPLDGAITAGGITALTPAQVAAMESPTVELAAQEAGGLFKTVQAPLQPGAQTLAVLLVHPRGVISATKRVRVVADRAALDP